MITIYIIWGTCIILYALWDRMDSYKIEIRKMDKLAYNKCGFRKKRLGAYSILILSLIFLIILLTIQFYCV